MDNGLVINLIKILEMLVFGLNNETLSNDLLTWWLNLLINDISLELVFFKENRLNFRGNMSFIKYIFK